MAVAVLDLTPALAVFRAEMVAQDGEEPCRHVRAGVERVDVRERAQKRLLHQVSSAIRDCAATRHRTENGFADRLVHRHQCVSFFSSPSRRLMSSLNRSGTPWFTTS